MGFLIRACLHLSAISNPTRPFRICKKWVQRLNTELFSQGDAMRQMKLPMSVQYDRHNQESNVVIKNQMHFMHKCVLPLAEAMNVIMSNELDWCLKSIKNNQKFWMECEKRGSLILMKNQCCACTEMI